MQSSRLLRKKATSIKDKYDIIVVGAGPAGSCAAVEAGKRGAKVLLLERKKTPGLPVQCAEYVPQQIKHYVNIYPEMIVQRTGRMHTYINDELCSDLAAPGYILDRQVFDRKLSEEAVNYGVELWTETRAIECLQESVRVLVKGEIKEIECRCIIGADGPRSTVGAWMNSENDYFMPAVQWTLPLKETRNNTEMYFSPEYIGGYAWMFPKGKYANVGVGVSMDSGERLTELHRCFVSKMIAAGVVENTEPIYKTGGIAPVGGPLPRLVHENMLLVGDAAGQTHPVSAGGIMNAVVCGCLAGQIAAKALNKNDISLLSGYETAWRKVLGRNLDHATAQRRRMDEEWTMEPQAFVDLIRETWLSFA